jgi:thioredoxin 1
MKREGIRSVPAFHFWKNGEKIDSVSGARIDDVEQAIISNNVK